MSENYPDLKANAAFRDLQAQLEGTENRIAIERMRFNEASRAFNSLRGRFPHLFLARAFPQRFAARQQMSRIGAALEVYRLEKGALPTTLRELSEVGILSTDDLHYPWRDDYFYRRTDKGAYVLLPPLR